MDLQVILIILANLDVILSEFNQKPMKPQFTSILKHPYHVKVYTEYLDSCSKKSVKRCGGAILSENVVITAAHCLKKKFKSTIMQHFIEYGTTFKNIGKGTKIKVKEIITRQDFDICKNNNADMALLILEKPIKFSRTAQPIFLNYFRLPVNQLAENVGFDYIVEDECLLANKTDFNTLRSSKLSVLTQYRCKIEYEKMTTNQFCAGFINDDYTGDTCQGEAGGPLVYGEKLIGIASYGEGCSKFGSPRVYSSIKAMWGLIRYTLRSYSNK